MSYSDRFIIERGSQVDLRRISSLASSGSFNDRAYESDVIEVYDSERIKLSLPKQYGETVTLSLDGIYEISIRSEGVVYHGRGRILERFRDEDGDVCIFRLTENLSKEDKRKYLVAHCDMVGEYTIVDSDEGGETTIKAISMDSLILRGSSYIPDNVEISVSFLLDNTREIRSRGTVGETIRLRSGDYETNVNLHHMSLPVQQELAYWLLHQAD